MTKSKNNPTKASGKPKVASKTTKAIPIPPNAIVRSQLHDLYLSMEGAPIVAGVKFVYIPNLLGDVVTTYALLRLPATKTTKETDYKWLVASAKCSAGDLPCKAQGKAIALGRLRRRTEELLKMGGTYIQERNIPKELKQYVYNSDQHIQIYNRRNKRVSKIDWIKSHTVKLRRVLTPKKYQTLMRYLNTTIFSA